jgi:hypothetical protein
VREMYIVSWWEGWVCRGPTAPCGLLAGGGFGGPLAPGPKKKKKARRR